MIKRETPIPAVVKWLFGPLLLAAGGLGLAVAFGLIQLEPSRTHAPLWIGGAIGVSFASVFNWVAFGPGERHFTTRTSVGSGAIGVTTVAEGGELGGRIAFGVFALLLDLLIASPLIVWLWRRVRSSPGSPSSSGKGS